MHLTRRLRRLRSSAAMRALVRETELSRSDLILPLFVSEKITGRAPVATMPGVFQCELGELADEAASAHDAGVRGVLLFGIPAHKDERASAAYAENGIVQRAVQGVKARCPDLL